MKKLTTLDELFEVKKLQKVVVNFTAPSWCRPCQVFDPIYHDAEPKSEVPLYVVDIDEAPDLAANEGISSVPSVLYYKDGEQTERLQPTGLPKFVEKLNSL